jgi:hypothetical protein
MNRSAQSISAVQNQLIVGQSHLFLTLVDIVGKPNNFQKFTPENNQLFYSREQIESPYHGGKN